MHNITNHIIYDQNILGISLYLLQSFMNYKDVNIQRRVMMSECWRMRYFCKMCDTKYWNKNFLRERDSMTMNQLIAESWLDEEVKKMYSNVLSIFEYKYIVSVWIWCANTVHRQNECWRIGFCYFYSMSVFKMLQSLPLCFSINQLLAFSCLSRYTEINHSIKSPIVKKLYPIHNPTIPPKSAIKYKEL